MLSAFMLGLYDVAKKRSLVDNAVLPVLLLSNVVSVLLFLPAIIASQTGADWFVGSMFAFEKADAPTHLLCALKGVIVSSTWIFGFVGLKHLPLTIVGPINATRPVLVLLGSILIFGERLNLLQWVGVAVAVVSFYLLSRSSRREGIDFRHNRWIWCMVGAVLTGAASALFDRVLMRSLNPVAVQSWSNVYIMLIMTVVTLVAWLPRRRTSTPFRWRWSIVLISLFVSTADLAYFYALSLPDSMLSIISLIRRTSVIVSFACGAILFKEKNLRSKTLDVALLLLGLVLLLFGSFLFSPSVMPIFFICQTVNYF